MKILFLPMDGHGHVNACVGLARTLRDSGHECIFMVPKNWKAMLESHKFSVETTEDTSTRDDKESQEKWAKFMENHLQAYAKDPKDQLVELILPANREFVKFVQQINDQVSQLISKVTPDLIVIDFYATIPSVVKSGIPWFWLYSSNPLEAYKGPNRPPKGAGFGANDDPKLFQEFIDFAENCMADLKEDFDRWLVEKGVEPDPYDIMSPSPYLNIYSYPEDLDYQEFGPVPDKWFRLDHMVRIVDEGPLGFDPSSLETEDKLVFFTLGSMGSSDVNLMKKLLAILAKSKHKFIVSKGPFHDKFDLAENMTGGKFLNQMQILPRVDLVIHHGGNNSFVETLYFGKPCIVLPLFADQHDNGRRAADKGIGKCFYPHKVTEKELLDGIDEILENQDLIEKVSKIGERIRNSKSHAMLVQKVEQTYTIIGGKPNEISTGI